jgi:hypothetical protein
LPNNISDSERGAGGVSGLGGGWRAAPIPGWVRGARGAGAGRTSIGGGSGWTCSADGAIGFDR